MRPSRDRFFASGREMEADEARAADEAAATRTLRASPKRQRGWQLRRAAQVEPGGLRISTEPPAGQAKGRHGSRDFGHEIRVERRRIGQGSASASALVETPEEFGTRKLRLLREGSGRMIDAASAVCGNRRIIEAGSNLPKRGPNGIGSELAFGRFATPPGDAERNAQSVFSTLKPAETEVRPYPGQTPPDRRSEGWRKRRPSFAFGVRAPGWDEARSRNRQRQQSPIQALFSRFALSISPP